MSTRNPTYWPDADNHPWQLQAGFMQEGEIL